MKLLYLLRYWPTRSETFVVREIAELQRRGHQVTIAAIGERADGVEADDLPTVAVWRPPRGLGRTRTLPASLRANGPTWDWLRQQVRPRDAAAAAWVAERAMGRGFDRVHAHFAGEAAEWARWVADACGCPMSVTVHAVDLFVPRPSIQELLRAARPAITVCRHHAKWIFERYGVEARVVRCGVDPGRFTRNADQDGPLRIVTVARWAPKKGLDTLLEAVRALQQHVTLDLVSDAPASVASDRVSVGPLAPSQVPAALARAHVFALPCRVAPDGNRDGIPVALIEAMAAGLPVISTAVSGIPELVDESVGWVVPPDDSRALIRALEHAADPQERERRGLAGRERVRSGWTLNGQVDALLDAWRSN